VSGYIAPAAKVFTVAHVRDEEVNSTGCPEGETICGMPLEETCGIYDSALPEENSP